MKQSKDLGEALSRIHKIIRQREEIHIVLASELSRKDRELLTRAGWLQEIIKGWYLLVRPDIQSGDSSDWYATFWDFLYVYLSHFYGKDYCLSAEHSLDLHLGKTVVPKQVIVMAPKGRGSPLDLPFDTSVLIYASREKLPLDRKVVQRLQVMSLPYALCKISPTFFRHQPCEAEIALQSIKNSDELLNIIIKNNFTRAASRLVGAYRFLGNKKMADNLLKGLAETGIKVQEINPFIHEKPCLTNLNNPSPYAARIVSMWRRYRTNVITYFPKPPGLPIDAKNYLKKVDEKYSQDAYHSLSIEGYQVGQDLIEKVKNAKWNPQHNTDDRKQSDALAARGYYEAFLALKESLSKILNGAPAGEIVESDLAQWYRKLMAPNVAAGMVNASDLFGYRRHQVYIRNSRHIPLPAHALNDAMDAFFLCIKREEHAGVRAVLGHFIFVFIHPFMDGNGRIGRLLMNAMLASGGYAWKIIHLQHRTRYLDTLEEASTKENIIPFIQFLVSE